MPLPKIKHKKSRPYHLLWFAVIKREKYVGMLTSLSNKHILKNKEW